MTRRSKTVFFFLLLIINHILHTYEVYTEGYLSDVRLIITNPRWFFIVQTIILFIMIYLTIHMLRKSKWALPTIRIISGFFLLYGSILAFGNIYTDERIIGSFTGFFHVMISLPLILWISDELKKQ